MSECEGAYKHGFLSLLDDADLRDLRAIGRVQKFGKGTYLLAERQVGDRVMALLRGRVKIIGADHTGREVVLGFGIAGELLGELSVIDGRTRSGSIAALEPVETLTISGPDFLGHLTDHPHVALAVMRTLCQRLRAADRKRIAFATSDSLPRVATSLLELAERFGVPTDDGGVMIELPLTQEELAAWSGCSREAVARALQHLRDLSWVHTARRRITITNVDALRTRAE